MTHLNNNYMKATVSIWYQSVSPTTDDTIISNGRVLHNSDEEFSDIFDSINDSDNYQSIYKEGNFNVFQQKVGGKYSFLVYSILNEKDEAKRYIPYMAKVDNVTDFKEAAQLIRNTARLTNHSVFESQLEKVLDKNRKQQIIKRLITLGISAIIIATIILTCKK